MASIVTGTITVNISVEYGGEFAGIYTGDFSYDDTHLTKVGTEVIGINTANRNLPGLLSLNFRFLDFDTGLTPVTYTARDDSRFPISPVLAFENGIPTEFGFLVDPDKKGGILGANNGFGFLSPKFFRFAVRGGTIGGEGLVTLEINKPISVAENYSPVTSLLAVLSLGAAYFWRN
ncbi:MAG: hypothetical protein HC916_15265 [Coleofasciculaceae cyanobacterium SM2_1_6]|nr:hypothetical protein [Coleofasciculaceae cyanobacterium SM2_1_6]